VIIITTLAMLEICLRARSGGGTCCVLLTLRSVGLANMLIYFRPVRTPPMRWKFNIPLIPDHRSTSAHHIALVLDLLPIHPATPYPFSLCPKTMFTLPPFQIPYPRSCYRPVTQEPSPSSIKVSSLRRSKPHARNKPRHKVSSAK
jgi:hypothetical protein